MAGRKRSGRRRRRGFGFFSRLLMMLAICAVIVVALTLFFKVDAVSVSGNSHYTAQQIESASGVAVNDNLLLLNKYAVVQRLQKELPYIEDVRINKQLPSTLLIDVTECSSTFAFTQDGTVWLVSPKGKIVESVRPAGADPDAPAPGGQSSQEAAPPAIDGGELLAPSVGTPLVLASERKTQQESLLALLSALEEAGLTGQVEAIHLGSVTELTMDYAGRFSVVMPYGGDYPKLMKYLTAVVGQLETNLTGVIDLTREGEPHFRPG